MRKTGATTFKTPPGFTLVELLIVISVVGVLAGLLLPVLSGARRRADRAVAVCQMRQIQAGIALYASEHNSRYPGPLWPGQIPMPDSAQSGRLAVVLAPYVGVTVSATPQLAPLFIPPAYRRAVTPAFLLTARTYVMNMAVPSANGAILNPWGNIAVAGEAPLVTGLVPSTSWAFSDADQLHPRVTGAPWKANTPPAIVHSPSRLAARFDGSVSPVDDTELAIPVP